MRQFETALFRLLVFAQSLEHWSAHLQAGSFAGAGGFMGPLDELDLRDQLRLYIVDPARRIRLARKRILVGLEPPEQLPHLRVRLVGEAAARLTDRDEAVLVVIQAEHERAEILPRAARVGVAADHALLRHGALDLQPLAGALLFVTARPPLGDDAFELLLLRSLEELQSFFGKRLRQAE